MVYFFFSKFIDKTKTWSGEKWLNTFAIQPSFVVPHNMLENQTDWFLFLSNTHCKSLPAYNITSYHPSSYVGIPDQNNSGNLDK